MVRVYTPKKIAARKEQAGNFGWRKNLPATASRGLKRKRVERPKDYGAISSQMEKFLVPAFVGKIVSIKRPRKGGKFTMRVFRIKRDRKGRTVAKELWQGRMER